MYILHIPRINESEKPRFFGLGLPGAGMDPIIRYVIRRILFMIPVFLGVTILVFYMISAIGDPVQIMLAQVPNISQQQIEMVRNYFGMNLPVSTRYLTWLWGVMHLDFGVSIFKVQPVASLLSIYGIQTLKLQLASIAISLVISIFLAIASTTYQYTKKDAVIMSSALLSRSIPAFWLGLIFILIFSYWLGIFPSHGAVSIEENLYGNQILDELWHMVLPTLMLTSYNLPTFTLLLRSSMMDVSREEFILASRASGLTKRTVIYKHTLRNAIIPLVAYVMYTFGIMIASSPVTETVFTWPGVGVLFVQAITNLDYPVIMGVIVLLVITVLSASLIGDILYAVIDPRIKLQ